MVNPYISYETYLLSKDKETSSFKSGINMAMDYDHFRNLELDCGFEHFVYAPNSPEVKILYAHPKFNVFFYDLIHLSVWLDYEYHHISKSKTLENHGFGLDISMLFDF